MRKIIQIQTTEHDLIALCDDGTVWVRKLNSYSSDWQKLPNVGV